MREINMKKVELIAYISIILMSLVTTGTLIEKYVNRRMVSTNTGIPLGSHMKLEGVNWNTNKYTLMFFLSTSCSHCRDSAPFYRQLLGESTIKNAVRFIAVFPQDLSQSGEYLKSLNIPITEVKQAQYTEPSVRVSPTLVLTNNKGEVIDSWMGQLQSKDETHILNRLRTLGTGQ